MVTRLGRTGRAAMAVAAVAATVAGCTWPNDAPISLPFGAPAGTYPSTTSVFEEGNVLDGISLYICGIQASAGNLLDGVIQSPGGGKVSVLSGLDTSGGPTDVLVLDEGSFSHLLATLGPNAGVLRARPARHLQTFVVPAAKKARVLRHAARQFRRLHAHSIATAVRHAGLAHAADLPSGAPTDCDNSNQLTVVGEANVSSLPYPAPFAPYGSDITSLLGSNPNGDWNLWVNSRSVETVAAPAHLRAHPGVVPFPGNIDSWELVLTTHDRPTKPFQDGGAFTVTGSDTAANPVTLTMNVSHQTSRLVTPTGQVDFIECTSPLCDGNTVGTASLVPDTTLGSSTATVTLPAGSLAPGTHTYEAVYYGDPNFDMITSPQQSIDIAGATSP